MGDGDSAPRAFGLSDLSDFAKNLIDQGFAKAPIDQRWTTVQCELNADCIGGEEGSPMFAEDRNYGDRC